jgi:hypothetical protein
MSRGIFEKNTPSQKNEPCWLIFEKLFLDNKAKT